MSRRGKKERGVHSIKIDLYDEKKFCNASKGSREFSQA
jgi:hypothetical protein